MDATLDTGLETREASVPPAVTEGSPAWREVAIALGGAALAGAATGFRGGVVDMAMLGAGMPLSAIGVAMLMVPSLCIGLAVAGVQGSTGAIVKACVDAAGAGGRVLLGISPALLVLGATGTLESSRAYAAVGLAGAVLVTLASARNLSRTAPAALPVFLGWAAVAAGIATLLVTRVLFGA